MSTVRAEGVESSNVVGYQTSGLLNNDYTMLGMQFVATDGSAVKLKDLQGDFFGGPSQADADNILIWLEDGYHFYYYGVWNDPNNPEWDNLWYDDTDYDASEVTIDAGRACWYLRKTDGDANITVSGAIKTTPVTATILANDYTMFANPYPVDIKLKDLSIINPFGGPAQADADNILIWLDDGYHFYYYGVWNNPNNPDWDNLWYDDTDCDASEVAIPAGRACWYLRRSDATTMSFTSPLAK